MADFELKDIHTFYSLIACFVPMPFFCLHQQQKRSTWDLRVETFSFYLILWNIFYLRCLFFTSLQSRGLSKGISCIFETNCWICLNHELFISFKAANPESLFVCLCLRIIKIVSATVSTSIQIKYLRREKGVTTLQKCYLTSQFPLIIHKKFSHSNLIISVGEL